MSDLEDHDDPGDLAPQPGDYSSRMEELLAEDDDVAQSSFSGDDESDEEEGFVYSGVDADSSTDYRSRLRDVLGQELDDEDEVLPRIDARNMHDNGASLNGHSQEIPELSIELADSTMALDEAASLNVHTSPSNQHHNELPASVRRPFLHPTISRLRSSIPTPLHNQSFTSSGFSSVTASHFSALSRASSTALRSDADGYHDIGENLKANIEEPAFREIFHWTYLRGLSAHVFHPSLGNSKAGAVLGEDNAGNPTVMSANGLVCVGMDTGQVFVFDFKQSLRCVCGGSSEGKALGAVTAVALSHDHTFIAVGHAKGHLRIFDLLRPAVPARSVSPVTAVAVSAGTAEGHLVGSRIVSIDFVASRHTAVVSADEHGLAFYHSLGKVLFVEASDVLRILGNYPNEEAHSRPSAQNGIPRPRRRRPKAGILAMAPLPLGPEPNATDAYQAVSLLTPTKLVVVGLKPTPRTWFKINKPATVDSGRPSAHGVMAWWPSHRGEDQAAVDPPLLAYTWGSRVNLLSIHEETATQRNKSSRTGKESLVDVSALTCKELGTWTVGEEVLALQWLNTQQLFLVMRNYLEVRSWRNGALVERVEFDSRSLMNPTVSPESENSLSSVAYSVRVYKGKVFMLTRGVVQVGTLLTWADRILHFVQDGDFLSAIDLTRSYYVGEAPGNRNGLPEDPQHQKEVVGEKLRELMTASSRYAFSEERMTDGTHASIGGRGVDRTSLFEGLVVAAIRACAAFGDFDFLFEDLFQQYDDAGISGIFLTQLEPFIIDGTVHAVAPRISQRLVGMHADNGRTDLVERLIWHIDPDCLDINQAIMLCEKYALYDALIYVYTRALRDYVAPLVQLLGLVRRVNRMRNTRDEEPDVDFNDPTLESLVLDAYRVYPYLANVLTGLTYPSEQPLAEEESFQAKKDIYTFLFFGRSSMWPQGGGGRLVLTADVEGGIEPTYPYTRLLLRFDAESFLHSLDLAFEDAYLNDESQSVSRLVIVKILLNIVASAPGLSQADTTLVNIFVARNVPKYPQFLQLPPTTLHTLLIDLAEDGDLATREDRQLAAEYLLSAYNPHETSRISALFHQAGFYRILRTWHRQERRWAFLITAFLEDTTVPSSELFNSLGEVLRSAKRENKGVTPLDTLATLTDAFPQLLRASVRSTAVLVDQHAPDCHDDALDAIGEDAEADRYIYLRCLLGPPSEEDLHEADAVRPKRSPSPHVPEILRILYISLQCRLYPLEAIDAIRYLSPTVSEWPQIMQECEDQGVYDAVIWGLDTTGQPLAALSKADKIHRELIDDILEGFTTQKTVTSELRGHSEAIVTELEAMGRRCIAICLEHSQTVQATDASSEDLWYQLLNTLITSVQNLSAVSVLSDAASDDALASAEEILTRLRSLVQKTFTAFVSISSTKAVSFPRLFKRLVESTATKVSTSSVGTPYTEFRTILMGMMESYRSEGDILTLSKQIVDGDLFETTETLTKERGRGWASQMAMACSVCRKPLSQGAAGSTAGGDGGHAAEKVVVSRAGSSHHLACFKRTNIANQS